MSYDMNKFLEALAKRILLTLSVLAGYYLLSSIIGASLNPVDWLIEYRIASGIVMFPVLLLLNCFAVD